VSWVYLELALVSLAAMLSPTTLTFSVLALVLAKRPLRTGIWFYLGAFVVTIVIGILAAFVLGDVAAPSAGGERKTWVSVFDLVAGALLVVYVARTWRVPIAEKTTKGMVEKMSSVASSPWIAVFAAGATLANPGGFIPLALKAISELNPTAAGYATAWLIFTFVSLLPLGAAIVLLLVSPGWAERLLHASRSWLEAHLRLIASVIILLLALSLLRNGISGLTG
jgi:Sap, sulfolipid-1-addressing protein